MILMTFVLTYILMGCRNSGFKVKMMKGPLNDSSERRLDSCFLVVCQTRMFGHDGA